MSLILTSIIDRAIALAKRREDVNRATYTDFVKPLVDAFEAVHDDYLRSLRRYRDLLKSSDVELDGEHPVMSALEEDALFSDSLRWQVRILPVAKATDKLVPLLDAVEDYLNTAADTNPLRGYRTPADEPFERMEASGIANVIRRGCVNGLYEISGRWQTEAEKRRRPRPKR